MSAFFTKKNSLIRKCFIALTILFSGISLNGYSQLVVNGAVTQAQLMAALVGQGLTITNVNLNCPAGAWGTFNGVSSNIGMNNGILLTTGNVNNAVGPNNSTSTSTCNGNLNTDPDLSLLEPFATNDVCILEFDIVPQCNNLQIRFVFGSEEYPEFVSSGFNDAFGFFITGPGPSCQPNFYNNTNVATLPNNTTIVSIDNINNLTNNTYYVDNTGGTTVQYDGFTTALTRNVSLCPCQTYHFKIAIGDAGDCIYDSGVFLDFIQCQTALTASSTSTNAGCSCTGTATAVGANSVGPYTYSWAPSGGTNATATGLCPGTYTCFVDDQVSCSAPVQTIVTITGTTVTATQSHTNASCFGGSNGTATVTPSGGTSPYTYVWAPSGGTNATATGLGNGTYTVTITDASGCTTTQIITITQPSALAATMTHVNPTCFGGTNGTATTTASGGTPGYTYNWTPSGGTGATGTGLGSGTYTVTITDANGCTTTQTVTLTQPTQVTASTGSLVNPTCGNNNGSATATAGGGTPGYTYSWAPSGQTGSTATGLGSGTYTVYITDANGCTQTATANLINSSGLGSSITASTNILCNGGTNGSATATGTGGSQPYTYVWSPSGGTNASATGLGAGTYTVVVTDASGCTSTQTITITQPAVLAATTSQVGALCNGNTNGQATVVVTGGTSGYTYNWAPSGGTNANATGLGAGTYTVTVTDANGCTTTQTIIVTQPTILSSSIGSIVNSGCGNPNGSMIVTATGGTGPYTYNWAPSGGTNANATGLGAGSYTVTITDANGCTSTATASITSSNISLTAAGAQTICIGQNATITATATGGTSPYTYSWAPNNSTASSVSVNPTTTTTYSVWVTDANGCTGGPQTVTIIVNPPLALTLTASPTSICVGGSATITTNASGGNGNYTYVWSPSGSGTSTTVSPTSTTTYTVTVNDNCGTPIATTTVTITVNQTPTACLTATNTQGCAPLCVNFSDCSTGATSWAWSFPGGTPSTSTQQNPSNICYSTPGVYNASVTVTSAAGCTGTTTSSNIVTVFPNPVAAFTQSVTPSLGVPATICNTDQSTGATIWNWTSGTNTSTVQSPCFTYTTAGIYCVTLVASNVGGCVDSITHCVEVVDDTFNLIIPNVFSPNGDGKNDIFLLHNIGVKELTITIYNRWGSLIYNGDALVNGWDGKTPSGGIASDGTYYYVVKGVKINGESIEEKGYLTLLSRKQ